MKQLVWSCTNLWPVSFIVSLALDSDNCYCCQARMIEGESDRWQELKEAIEATNGMELSPALEEAQDEFLAIFITLTELARKSRKKKSPQPTLPT